MSEERDDLPATSGKTNDEGTVNQDPNEPGPSRRKSINPKVALEVLIEAIESAIYQSEKHLSQARSPFLASFNSSLVIRDSSDSSIVIASTSAARFCRICHEIDSIEKYISPCWCKGSLSSVHRSCLERWLAESDSSHCELCSYVYVTKREPRHRLISSIVFYLKSPDSRRQTRILVMDILVCAATFPMATMGTYLGVLLADSINNPEAVIPSEVPMSTASKVVSVVIVSLMMTMDFAYLTWMLYRVQFHISQWYSWYRRNSKVTLVHSLESENEAK